MGVGVGGGGVGVGVGGGGVGWVLGGGMGWVLGERGEVDALGVGVCRAVWMCVSLCLCLCSCICLCSRLVLPSSPPPQQEAEGQVCDGGASVYYSHTLQMLFFSYCNGEWSVLLTVGEGVCYDKVIPSLAGGGEWGWELGIQPG